MSYDIVYGKCFVKLGEDLFVPIIVYGASNCYEYTFSNRQRRERCFSHWGNWGIGERIRELFTREDIETKLKAWDKNVRETNQRYASEGIGVNSDPTRIDGLVKYGGDTFTMRGWRKFIKHGIESAKTIEELCESGLNLRIFAYKYNESIEVVGYPKTTAEFFEIYNRVINYCKENEDYRIQIDYTNSVDYVLKRFKTKRQRLSTSKAELKEYFIIKNNERGAYYSNSTKRGIYWNHTRGFAKAFKTRKDAERSLNRIKMRFSSYNNNNILEIMRIENDKPEEYSIFDNI